MLLLHRGPDPFTEVGSVSARSSEFVVSMTLTGSPISHPTVTGIGLLDVERSGQVGRATSSGQRDITLTTGHCRRGRTVRAAPHSSLASRATIHTSAPAPSR